MKIRLHDNRAVEEPNGSQIEFLFTQLSDPGDFIILTDPIRGEVRAAGPHNGTFLIQCDLSEANHVFNGERYDVGLGETISIFLQFLSGNTGWRHSFKRR
jgi:hypothetical protein